MRPVKLPDGFAVERLSKSHRRDTLDSGQPEVDDWLKTKALQHQEKNLSVTKVLIDGFEKTVGYYTLATGQVDFGDLPPEVAKKLPRRAMPVAVLAWLGIARDQQGQGLGRLLLANALRDCHDAGLIFGFIAVIVDCVDESAKTFCQKFDFAELPGNPYRLFMTFRHLVKMMQG